MVAAPIPGHLPKAGGPKDGPRRPRHEGLADREQLSLTGPCLKPPSHFRRLISAVFCPPCRLELIRGPVRPAPDRVLSPADAAAGPAPAACAARFHGRPQVLLPAGRAR